MDEYYCVAHCDVYPHMSSIDCDALGDNEPYLNIEFDYTIINVPSDESSPSVSETNRHVRCFVSKDKEIQKATIVSWLSEIHVPKDAFTILVEEISQCVREMVEGTYKNSRGLSIRVDFSVTLDFSEGDEEEEEDRLNTLVQAGTRSIENDHYEIGYQDAWDSSWVEELDIEDLWRYNWEENMGIEEDNRFIINVASDEDEWEYGWEEGMEMEQDIRFVPAAKSCIEGLKMVTVEEAEKCSICFEDFKVGVCMPCSHMFHKDCIQDWLNIGNSCPLCRFQLN